MSKKVLGFITLTVVMGGAAYAIYQYKKEKDLEESDEVMTAEEARALVGDNKLKVKSPYRKLDPSEQEVIEEVERMFSFDDMVEEIDSGDELINNLQDQVEEIKTKEESVLRHDPNSIEALLQFKGMELADWVPSEHTHIRMLDLFDQPFHPLCHEDKSLHQQLVSYRKEFFGLDSRWNEQITFADVILHFARTADYNVGNGFRFWVEHILELSGLDDMDTSNQTEEAINEMNLHTYYNEGNDTFGLFGLERYDMDATIAWSSRNAVDGRVSYHMEFNTMLRAFR